ncbi:MAG: hypothetical protein ABI068_12215, partial [Ktedonobacterales bacterium]
GIAGPGPCQETPICPWTAGWDVTADGAHIIYHNPGPTTSPSDTGSPRDTPLYYANPDGSNAVKLSSDLLATGLTGPVLSPNGQYVMVSGSFDAQNPTASPQIRIAQVNGGAVQRVNGQWNAWRADSQAMVTVNYSASGNGTESLYTLATAASQPLEVNSSFYLWGN